MPNPPLSEGRPDYRFSGDVQTSSHFRFRWSETSFLVLSVNQAGLSPSLPFISGAALETSGFLRRAQLHLPSSCLLASYLPTAGFNLSVSACVRVSH